MGKNSTSFKKGEVHNPHGAPKKEYSISQTIRDMMDEKPEIKRALGAKIFEMALKGDITAIKTLWNYMDGMPQQQTDITSGGESIAIRIISDNKDGNSITNTELPETAGDI